MSHIAISTLQGSNKQRLLWLHSNRAEGEDVHVGRGGGGLDHGPQDGEGRHRQDEGHDRHLLNCWQWRSPCCRLADRLILHSLCSREFMNFPLVLFSYLPLCPPYLTTKSQAVSFCSSHILPISKGNAPIWFLIRCNKILFQIISFGYWFNEIKIYISIIVLPFRDMARGTAERTTTSRWTDQHVQQLQVSIYEG